MAEETVSIAALADERLKLEREAFELERGRLEAARARAEAELKIARAGHPFLVFASVTLLALFAFAGGMLLGVSLNDTIMPPPQFRKSSLNYTRSFRQYEKPAL